MITKPTASRFSKRAELFFKLTLLALVVLWVIFPPHRPKEQGSIRSHTEVVTVQRG